MRNFRKNIHTNEIFLQGLDDIELEHTIPQGAYYILIDISRFGYESDMEFAEYLAREIGVGAVPGSSFFKESENRYVRLHFAKKDNTLTEALNRLSKLKNL